MVSSIRPLLDQFLDGSRRYSRCSQNCLSFHASSQTVRAAGLPAPEQKLGRGRHKPPGLVEHVIGREQHFLLPENLFRRSIKAALFVAPLPVRFPSRPTYPHRSTASDRRFPPQVHRASCLLIEKALLFHQIPRRISVQG